VYITAKLYQRDLVSMQTMTELCMRYYIGREMQPIIDGSPEFYEKWLKPHLSKAMLAKMKEHREAGHALVLLTASLDYLMRPVFEDLGFDHLLCSTLEIDEKGRGTGRTIGPVLLGDQKRRAAMELSEKEGFDLALSYAYADHHSDIPLLEAVGRPVAVRPTRPLWKLAQKRQWQIISEG
jgi:HAD superfamily hydrolase (TIGR01490 family)